MLYLCTDQSGNVVQQIVGEEGTDSSEVHLVQSGRTQIPVKQIGVRYSVETQLCNIQLTSQTDRGEI